MENKTIIMAVVGVIVVVTIIIIAVVVSSKSNSDTGNNSGTNTSTGSTDGGTDGGTNGGTDGNTDISPDSVLTVKNINLSDLTIENGLFFSFVEPFNVTWTNSLTTSNAKASLTRIGYIVMLTLSKFLYDNNSKGNPSCNISNSTTISYIPKKDLMLPIIILDNNLYSPGFLFIEKTGIITIYSGLNITDGKIQKTTGVRSFPDDCTVSWSLI